MIYLETAADRRQGAPRARAASWRRRWPTSAPRWPTGRRCAGACAEDAERLADAEGAALLRWLGDGMLTQLGHVTRRRDGSHPSVLGICRKSARDAARRRQLRARVRLVRRAQGGKAGRAPLIIKANRLSRVHRRVPLDLFIVPRGRGRARSRRCRSMPAIWTSAALADPAGAGAGAARAARRPSTSKLDFRPGRP